MELETAARIRVKRFQRSETPPPLQLTARDLNLLAHVARHRFLSSAHLCALDGGSPQNVLRCLRALFDHGYLDRPAAQKIGLSEEGPRPFVYGLGKKGARALREHGDLIDIGVDWTEKNKRAGAIFIEHTLEVADFMTGLELACRGRNDVELMREREVLALAPEETRGIGRHARQMRGEIVRTRKNLRVRSRSLRVQTGLYRSLYPIAATFLFHLRNHTVSV